MVDGPLGAGHQICLAGSKENIPQGQHKPAVGFFGFELPFGLFVSRLGVVEHDILLGARTTVGKEGQHRAQEDYFGIRHQPVTLLPVPHYSSPFLIVSGILGFLRSNRLAQRLDGITHLLGGKLRSCRVCLFLRQLGIDYSLVGHPAMVPHD